MLNIVILCGGNGTRLWPLSRKSLPKQFLKLLSDDYTMFQLTLNRIKTLQYNKIYIISNLSHTNIIQNQINEIDLKNYIIISEPTQKNTCAAIATVCHIIPDNENILIMSSDHLWDDDKFVICVNKGLDLVNQGIIFFGVKPTYAETGYGYIKYENNNLIEFKEKPNKIIAKEYINKGYLWNSGNFLFNCKIMKNELIVNAKDIFDNTKITIDNSIKNNNQIILNNNLFSNIRDESIDYAVMENYKFGKIIIYDGIWNDIGSFNSVYDISTKNESNVIKGNVKTLNTTNSLINTNDKLIVTIGVDNLVIINTEDAIMVCNKNNCQDIKKIVNQLNNNII